MNKFHIYFVITIIIFCFQNKIIIAQKGSIPENAMGARSYAMGKCALLSYSGANHVSMNPSSICDTQKLSASIFYTEYNPEVINSSFGVVYPTEKYGNFGVSYFYIGVKGISRRDQNNISLGDFTFNQNHFLLMYGRNINNNFSIGLNAKFVSLSMADFKSYVKNIGLDLGVKYMPKFSYFPIKIFHVALRLTI